MLSIQIPFYNLVLLPFSLFIFSKVEIFTALADIRERVLSLREAGKKIGFVPTMGALHQGHEQLIKTSLAQTDITVVSIFVNPAQFNNAADFEKYPNKLEEDIGRLKKLGCHMVFTPASSEMYPASPLVKIAFPSLQHGMEGAFRPGHFEGVALVVAKLFHLVPAHKAYFGQKDWQQYLIIKQLVADLAFNIQVVPVATVREPDGLAMSSRNLRLSAEGRKKAVVFNRMLINARQALLQGKSVAEVRISVELETKKTAGASLEYFEVVNRETLQPVERVDDDGAPVSLFIAGYVEGVRLIDNIFLKEETEQPNAY